VSGYETQRTVYFILGQDEVNRRLGLCGAGTEAKRNEARDWMERCLCGGTDASLKLEEGREGESRGAAAGFSAWLLF
jgi:hypothetical protein